MAFLWIPASWKREPGLGRGREALGGAPREGGDPGSDSRGSGVVRPELAGRQDTLRFVLDQAVSLQPQSRERIPGGQKE